MYSQKNRNKSFIYEEEIDQANREKVTKKIDSKRRVNKGRFILWSSPRIQGYLTKIEWWRYQARYREGEYAVLFLKRQFQRDKGRIWSLHRKKGLSCQSGSKGVH